jgi:hypothetical protein
MKPLVLYCKSYHKDVDLAKNLKLSIDTFNKNKIEFYISVPNNDLQLFKNKLGGSGYNLIADEDIIKEELPESWLKQQCVKSSFWKLNISKNYLMLDSDSFFIKDFYLDDFMYDQETPYTIMHEQQDLFQWSSLPSNKAQLGFDPQESFISDRLKIMKIFNTDRSVFFDFGPSPCIWNCQVWHDLEEKFIKPNKTSFYNLLQHTAPSEITWYGEALLYFKSVELIPRSPLFKVFHYQKQYDDFLKLGGNIDTLKQCFMGVILQSNWFNE